MKPHKKIIYIGFGGFAIVKTIIFFFGLIAGIFGIGNVFADDNNCSILTRDNINTCCNTTPSKLTWDCKNKNINTIEINAFSEYYLKVWKLDLSENNISDISFIKNLKSLRVINLNNNIISDISIFSGMNIQELNLNNNKINNVYPLNFVSNLEKLYLSNNNINDISSISLILTLNTLELNNNHIAMIDVSSLYMLENLQLGDNWIEDISSIQSIQNKLTYLDIHNNCIDLDSKDIINFVDNFKGNIIYESQRNCSNWTGADVTIIFSELTGSFDDLEGSCNESLTGAYFWLNTGENSLEPEIWDQGTDITITCDTGNICKSTLKYYFVNSNNESCGTGEIPIQIDKKAPTCEIEQDAIENKNNIYRPTNHSIILNVITTDEGIGKIAYSGYKRNEDERDISPTTTISENDTYFVMVRDAVGNETGCSITVSNIDRTPPAPVTGGNSACFSGNTTVSFSETNHEIGSGFGGSYIVYSTGDTQLSCSSSVWENGSNQVFSETTILNIGVCDEAGNITTGEYTYARDRAPITTISGYNRQWTGGNVVLKFNIDDGHELCKKEFDSKTYYCTYTYGENECSNMTNGENINVNCNNGAVCQTYIKYYSVNGSGMTESTKTGLVKIDKEAPSCNISQEPEAENYTSGSVVLSAIANDGIGSNDIQYNWTSTFGSNTQSGVFSNGNYSLIVKDFVGNERSCEIEISNIDKTSPTTTIIPGNDNYAKKSREITIIANDDLAGFVENQNFKYYWSDTSTCTTNQNSYTLNKNFDSYEIGSKNITGIISKSDEDGPKYLCIFGGIQDRAGNTSITSNGGPYLFDNTGPTGDIQISYNGFNGYASGYELTLSLTGSDIYSDISGMQFSCNNRNWTEIEPFMENKSFNLSDYKNYGCNTGDGTKTIYVKLIDSIGNIGNSISGNIILDTTAPSCTINQGACTSGTLLLTLTGNESLTGVSLANRTFVNNKTYTILVTSNDMINIVVNDLAGNKKNCSITPTNYDVNGPTIAFENIEVDECMTKTWSVSATDSGCAGIGSNAYKFNTSNMGEMTWGNATLALSKEYTLSGGTAKDWTVTVKDNLGNKNTKSATLTIRNTNPTIGNITGQISGLLTGDKSYGNVVNLLNVNDGACGTGTITASLIGECTNATKSNIQSNVLTIKPDQNMEGNGICTIEFKDDEGNSITGFVIYTIDTRRPEIAECTANACFKNNISVSCSETKSESGNKIVYSTGNDISCNSPTRSTKTFSSSTTLKVAVCDTVGHISDISTYHYNLDNQAPSTTLSGLPIGWTGNNLNLGVSIQDNCEQADTYYCLTGINNSCINSDFKKLSGDSIDTICPVGELCEYTIWYYSVDGAGNQETLKSGTIQIDMKELTCEITFDDNICTNSGIKLTLQVSKPIINDLGSWMSISGEENTYYMYVYGNDEISVEVFDHINNNYTCTAHVNNFDDKTPIIYSEELYTGYECNDITISPEITDEGCADGLTYIWDSMTGNSEYKSTWYNNTLDINTINLKVTDAAGNNTNKKIKYQWINRPITGQDFEIETVGTGISVNWKLSGHVSAGECESELITGVLINSGSIGDCILNGDILEYIPYPGRIGNDVCMLTISDGDGEISISTIFKGIDNNKPIIIAYTGGFGDICTDQQSTKVFLSFNETVNGIFADSITGYNINITNFSSGSDGAEYAWDIELSGEGTGEIWINSENIKDTAGNTLSGNINHIYLGYYDIIGPNTPLLLNYTGGEISENASISLQWQESTTTGCAILEKYEIMVCTDINMSEGCKTYESYTNRKTIVKENGAYYRKVVAIDSNNNRSDYEIGHFEINSNNPTCIIESIGTCTSGAIELHLTASEDISFINNGGINWIGNGKNWAGSISENRIITGIIIKDNDDYTGTCDEFIVSSFDDITPTTNISGNLTQIGGKYWSKDDIEFELFGTDEGCGNDGISTYYCVSDTNECTNFVQGTNIHVTGQDYTISTKHIKYYSVDVAGNKEENKSIEINIDKQGPSCEIGKSISNKTNGSIVISLSGDDEGVGLSLFPYAWYPEKNWINQNSLVIRENGLYTGYISDILGNENSCDIDIENIDTIPPTGVTCNKDSNSCFSDSLSVTCEEETHEDGNIIVYTTDGTNPSCSSNSGNTFSFTGDTILKIAVCDSVGNMSDISTYTYVIDDEAPHTTAEGLPSGDGWTGNNLIISLSGIDYGCAKGADTYYCLYDSGNSCTTFATGTEISISCTNGNTCVKYLEYYSTDYMGNKESTQKHTIKIDKQGPSCEITQTPSSTSYTSGSVILEINGNDGIGIKSFVWSGNLGKQKRLSINENGMYTVTVSDILGNQSQCSINVANIDNIKPQGVNCNIMGCTSGYLNINCTQVQSESGNKIVYTTNGLSPNCDSNIWDNKGFSGTTALKIAVCDKVGNMSDVNTFNYTPNDFSNKCSTSNTGNNTGSSDNNSGDINSGDINSGDINSGNISSGDINSGNITSGDVIGENTGDFVIASEIISYCLTSWNNDNFIDEVFRNNYDGNTETGHNQLICALFGYSGDYKTAYSLGRSGYDANSCTGTTVIETGILLDTLQANTIYVLTTGKLIISDRINMENCSAIISKTGTIVYSNKYFDENNEATMIRTKSYTVIDSIDFDGINNGTGGNHIRNYHGIDVYSDSTLNNVKSYHNGHGILIGGRHINLNNIQTFGNDGVGIWESSSIGGTNTYNTYNNIQSYNNRDAGFNIRGLNSVLNNTMVYNNGYDTGNASWDDITNPKDNNGSYLINWTTQGINNAKGLKTIGEIVGYSYGIGIKTQQQPMVYRGDTLISGGNYYSNKYIGSNVTKITGSTDIIYDNTYGELNFMGNSNYSGVNKYTLFIIGNTNTGLNLNGIDLGKGTGTKNNGYNTVITQLLGNNYFATHYKKDISVGITQSKYEKFIPNKSKYNWAFSDEMNEAYQYSYEYNITTMPDIIWADMYGNLTRIAMAKMISNYAINILGMTPDSTKIKKFMDVSDDLDYQYDYGVQKAYQLGIMGQNMPNNEFRPYDLVTRAEFATTLSRLLYNMEDGKPVYYEPHIYILNRMGIISDTNPNLQERRGYVMLMLLRYHQHNSL